LAEHNPSIVNGEGQLMMLDWNTYPAELSVRVKEMSQLAPNAVAGFIALDKGANKTVHLDAKTRELIAVAIAVTTRCDAASACIPTAPSMPVRPAKK
jgi:alkylhydroperoxidase/carboxymuconolactone decarboxylase family protein YurZ